MLQKLRLIETHRTSLEKCVFCPKLCRASCPVSNEEANETVTPWGKMSLVSFVSKGAVPLDEQYGAPSWACSGCYACKERCDHHNDVAQVLMDARAEMFAAGVAPKTAQNVANSRARRVEDLNHRVSGLGTRPAKTGVLIGCGYIQHAPEVARDAIAAVEAISGEPIAAIGGCCGLDLYYAGDRAAFLDNAAHMLDALKRYSRVVVVDPGCARALSVEYQRMGLAVPKIELFVDVALGSARLNRSVPTHERVRYHDPCQLGRGLNRFDEPRNLIARITGNRPEEFMRSREWAECSGGGGLLPLTRTRTSDAMSDARIREHRQLGGGRLVTGCAQSLRRFRKSGEAAVDLVSLVASALVLVKS